MTSSEAIRKNKEFLEEHMDPDFGLVDKIRASGNIGWREIEDVTSEISSWKRNSKLLAYILEKDQSDCLIAALRDADQMHIVNYLTANGKYADTYGEEWPLTSKEMSILDTNHGSLVDLLDLTDLLSLLYSSKVINNRQKDSISSKPTLHEKSEALLQILRRRSLRDYRETVTCLHMSQQSHIAEILSIGGGVVRVHAHMDAENVTEDEREIVTMIADILINRSIDQPSRILELVNHRVIAARTGQSVVLYIYCKTIEDLEQLHESLLSGRLKNSVELWFNFLLKRSEKITVSAVTVPNEEFQTIGTKLKDLGRPNLKRKRSDNTEVIETFQQKEQMVRKTETRHASETTLNHFPFKLLGIVLAKSLLCCILNSSIYQKDEDVISSLASVDFCWFQRITSRGFKNRFWQQLKGFYENNQKRRKIIANNKIYILENIQPNDVLIASLLSVNCITQCQSHFINRQRLRQQQRLKQRQRGTRDKNTELLHVMPSNDEKMYSNVIKCLRQANQTTLAKIMENGGVAIKVEVQTRISKHRHTVSVEKQLLFHKMLEYLPHKQKPWSRQISKLISLLSDDGIEILKSQADRQTVVVWLWCRSQEGLQNIQELYESKQLIYVFLGFANIRRNYSEIIKSIVININSDQFKRIVVGSPTTISFTDRVVEEGVRSLAKLRNEINMICRPTTTRVD